MLTVRETLSLFSSFYPSPRPVDETVELVGLAGERNARVRTLSGGQKRRLDVAVALVGDPSFCSSTSRPPGSIPPRDEAPGT